MTDEPGFASAARIAAICQVAFGESQGDPLMLDLDGLPERFRDVAPVTSFNDAAMAVFVLSDFCIRLGSEIHLRLHAGNAAGCGFDPEQCVPLLKVDRANPAAWHPAPAIEAWVRRYRAQVAHGHDLLAERARVRLRGDLAGSVSLSALARDTAASPSVLRRRFMTTIGETPLRHRTRLRVVQAIELIRKGWKLDAVAATVGWRGRKDLYRAVQTITGLSVADIRSMPDFDAERLLVRVRASAAITPGRSGQSRQNEWRNAVANDARPPQGRASC